MEGWIKLHRQITDNWIWDNPEYLKAWLTIIFTVNYVPKKVLIQGELLDCNRGQSLISLDGWADKFKGKWTVQRVRTFFDLLKKDKMITVEGLRKTTRLTVCNYELYQDLQQTENRETTGKEQGDNKQITTTKESKEQYILKIQNDFLENINQFKDKYGQEMVTNFYNYWSEPNISLTKIKWQLEKTWDLSKRLQRWHNNDFKNKPKTTQKSMQFKPPIQQTYPNQPKEVIPQAI